MKVIDSQPEYPGLAQRYKEKIRSDIAGSGDKDLLHAFDILTCEIPPPETINNVPQERGNLK